MDTIGTHRDGKQAWTKPSRVELAARHTQGGSSPGPIELVIPQVTSCYPGGGGTGS